MVVAADVRIGVDVGGTKSHAVAVDDSGRVVAELRRPTGFGVEEVLQGLTRAVADLTGEVEQRGHRVRGIGVGIPGLVDRRTQRVSHAVNLGVDELDLQPVLAARFGVPVLVDNDVNAAALGAARLYAPAADSLAYLNVGTGIAAGVVVGGRVWRGLTGSAGEIGHIPVHEGGLLCGCGQRGCLETVASGSGLARSWPTDHPAPVVHLLAARAGGDPRAAAVWTRFVDGVARAVQLLCATFDPEKVVVGGGISEVGEPFSGALLGRLAENEVGSPFLATLGARNRLLTGAAADLVAPLGAALLVAPTSPAGPAGR